MRSKAARFRSRPSKAARISWRPLSFRRYCLCRYFAPTESILKSALSPSLGRLSRRRVTVHQLQVTFGNMPFPEGRFLSRDGDLEETNLGMFGHQMNMCRRGLLCYPGTCGRRLQSSFAASLDRPASLSHSSATRSHASLSMALTDLTACSLASSACFRNLVASSDMATEIMHQSEFTPHRKIIASANWHRPP